VFFATSHQIHTLVDVEHPKQVIFQNKVCFLKTTLKTQFFLLRPLSGRGVCRRIDGHYGRGKDACWKWLLVGEMCYYRDVKMGRCSTD